jgi:hypothetical protein
MFATYDVGQTLLGKLASQQALNVTVNVQIEIVDLPSDNIIAQTKWGNPDKVGSPPSLLERVHTQNI